MDYSAMSMGNGMPIQWFEEHLNTNDSVNQHKENGENKGSTSGKKIKPVFTIKSHNNDITSIDFAGRNLLATGSLDKTVRVYKWLPGDQFEELAHSPLKGHTYGINGVAFSPYGSKLASASTDGQTFIWDVKKGEMLISLFLPVKKGFAVRTCVFSSNSALLATGGDGDSAALWDISNFSLKRELAHDSTVTSVSFSPDSTCLATGCTNGDLKVWDVAFGHALPLLSKVEAHDLGIYSLHFNPFIGKQGTTINGNRYMLASGGQDTDLHLWIVTVGLSNSECKGKKKSVGVEPASLKVCHTFCGHRGPIMMVKFASTGSHLASASGDKTIRIWDTLNFTMLAVLDGHSRYVTSCCFSEDGSLIASGGGDRSVRVWRIADAVQNPSLLDLSKISSKLKSFKFSREREYVRDENPLNWTVSDVCHWLTEEGLGEYSSGFRYERINGRELITMTDSILKLKIGVDALGHRNRILRFISRYSNEENNLHSSSTATLPDEFLCPITHEVMKDPVLSADGFSYEREAVEQWLARGNNNSPVTNAPLTHLILTPNRTLKILIRHHLDKIS